MIRGLFCAAAALALSGCAGFQERLDATLSDPGLEYAAAERDAYRTYAAAFSEVPFSKGAVSVVAPDHGDLRTYTLVPCRGGTRICAGSAHGPAGTLERTPDYMIVRGLYGRTFWLSPGGDGALVWPGHTVPLAWN